MTSSSDRGSGMVSALHFQPRAGDLMAGSDQKLTAKLVLPDSKEVALPVVVGTEYEHAVDIRNLRQDSGYVTLDNGYMNTGSTTSAITYLDGEQGILRYRGYPIEE